MKISELHQLIGRPAFNIGDRVRIKATGQIGWVSHINLSHGLHKAYHYMIVDENNEYVKGHGFPKLHNGFFTEDIELDTIHEQELDAFVEKVFLYLQNDGSIKQPVVSIPVKDWDWDDIFYFKDFGGHLGGLSQAIKEYCRERLNVSLVQYEPNK